MNVYCKALLGVSYCIRGSMKNVSSDRENCKKLLLFTFIYIEILLTKTESARKEKENFMILRFPFTMHGIFSYHFSCFLESEVSFI